MIKLQNRASNNNENYSTLVSMGYKPEIVDLAMGEARNRNCLNELLDLIMTNLEEYSTVVTKKKEKSRKVSNEDDLEEFAYDKGEKGKNGKNSRKRKSKCQREEKEDNIVSANNQGNGDQDAGLPKVMEEGSAVYMDTIRRGLNKIDSKDPRDYVYNLSGFLKEMKFDTTETGKQVHKYLVSSNHYPQAVDLRKRVYEVIMKVMTMKRGCEVDIREFEYVLLMAFEVKILNSKQMDIILTTYNKFCNKAGHKQDDILISSLERHHAESKRPSFLSNLSQDQDLFLLNDYAILKCPNVTNAKKKSMDEARVSEKVTESTIKVPKKTSMNVREKEFCISCAERTREIVFLPCCHFLTCPSCSVDVTKCQICDKKVEKYLKIFWS